MARIFCSNCGHMVGEKANFCTFCGAATHGSASAVYTHAHEMQQPAQTPPPLVDKPTVDKQYVAQQIEQENISPLARIAFILNYIGKTGIIALILFISVFLEPLIALPALVAYFAVLTLVALLAWNHFSFTIDATSFQKQYGIFHKYNVTIPFNQIQNVNIRRSLVDQILGLARIDIETAGSSGIHQKDIVGGSFSKAEGHLPGITLKRAKELHDILLQKAASTN